MSWKERAAWAVYVAWVAAATVLTYLRQDAWPLAARLAITAMVAWFVILPWPVRRRRR